MGPVLDASGLEAIKPMAFAASALAALLSPLFFGAMADRSIPPARVLRWISLGTALMVWMVAWAIELNLNAWIVLSLIQAQSLFCAPASSLSGSIVFSRLVNSQRQFGSIRALGTMGWIAGCWTTSLLKLDSSPFAFYLSGILWTILAGYSLLLPHSMVAISSPRKLTLRERFGLDALSLLRVHDNRVIFFTAALIAIPFAAFYPFTPAHLTELGLQRISAWMSLGQVTEIVAMIMIGMILGRWRLKWVILAGLACGLLRYALYALDAAFPVLVGVGLHGFAFTLTYISTQIYLAERIDPEWRTRAQALLSLMTAGVGNLTGYLLTGLWLRFNQSAGQVHWSLFWGGLAVLVLLVLVYFSRSYHSKT